VRDERVQRRDRREHVLQRRRRKLLAHFLRPAQARATNNKEAIVTSANPSTNLSAQLPRRNTKQRKNS
jgi:hypothetical protein